MRLLESIDSDTRKEIPVRKGEAVTSYLGQGSDKCLEFLERCADVPDACVKTISGRSSDSIQTEMRASPTSSAASGPVRGSLGNTGASSIFLSHYVCQNSSHCTPKMACVFYTN